MMNLAKKIYGVDDSRIFSTVPRGWRWATADETDMFGQTPDMRQVCVGGTNESPWTDFIVPV